LVTSVHNKPAIQYVVEEARQAGIDNMMIITGRNKEAIARHFDHAPDLYDQLKKDNYPFSFVLSSNS